MESEGILSGLITQNVDGLHQAAGSRTLVELHGALSRVRCLSCRALVCRHDLQQRMLAENPDSAHVPTTELAPDGDAEVQDAESFQVPRMPGRVVGC